MWEAFEHAAYASLDNLIAIIDVNRLGQRGETMHGWDLDVLRAPRSRPSAGTAIEIDGHDVDAIDRAYEEALSTTGRPTAIVARTIKGKGVTAVENQEAGTASRSTIRTRRSRSSAASATSSSTCTKPEADAQPHVFETGALELPSYERRRRGRDPQGLRRGARSRSARHAATSSRSTARSRTRPTPRVREGASRALLRDVHRRAAAGRRRGRAAGARLDAVRLDVRRLPLARVRLRPDGRDLQANIRLSARTRASRSARTGPRRWRSRTSPCSARVHGTTVLYPCDANQTAKLVAAMADLDGISFIRTTRGETPVIYGAGRGVPDRRQQGRPRGRRRRRSSPPASPCTRRWRPPTRSRDEGIAPA